MVDFVCAGNTAQFCVTARPNSVLGRPGLVLTMAVLLPACSVAAIAFLLIGAWPVTLFMALHILALVWAFHHVEAHAGDYERLTLDADRLVLDRHALERDQHLEFNSQWVQVAMHESASGGNILALRSHGKEVVFGHLLTDDERAALGRELRLRLARIKQ